MMSHPLDRPIKFLDKADGRDKLFKMLQNGFRFLAWYYTVSALKSKDRAFQKAAKESAKMYRELASSLSSYRNLHKFFKWLKTLKELQLALQAPEELSPGDMVDLLSSALDVCYKMSDNVEFLCSKKVLAGSPAVWEDRSKTFQFWGYLCAVVYDTLVLLQRAPPTGKEIEAADGDERKAAVQLRQKALLDFTKDFADFLRVATGRGHLTAVPAPLRPGFAGLMGVISGGVGTYQVWQKC